VLVLQRLIFLTPQQPQQPQPQAAALTPREAKMKIASTLWEALKQPLPPLPCHLPPLPPLLLPPLLRTLTLTMRTTAQIQVSPMTRTAAEF
jgi:hypothetical protein